MKVMKALFFTILSLVVTNLFAQDNSEEIIGLWNAEKAKVEIYKDGDKFIGNPLGPDGQKYEAIKVLDLKYKNEIWKGKLYSKEKDRYFDVECEVENELLILKVKAGFVSKTVKWNRIQ